MLCLFSLLPVMVSCYCTTALLRPISRTLHVQCVFPCRYFRGSSRHIKKCRSFLIAKWNQHQQYHDVQKRRWLMSMYSAGLAEGAAGRGGRGDGTPSPTPPGVSDAHREHQQQHQQQNDNDSYRFQHLESHQRHHAGDCHILGPSAPGWEEGTGCQQRGGRKRGWLQQKRTGDRRGGVEVDNDDDDGAILVRWSEELDFDR